MRGARSDDVAPHVFSAVLHAAVDNKTLPPICRPKVPVFSVRIPLNVFEGSVPLPVFGDTFLRSQVLLYIVCVFSMCSSFLLWVI